MSLEPDLDTDWPQPVPTRLPRAASGEAKQRLLRLGARCLSDAELVSLIAGTQGSTLLDSGLASLSQQTADSLLELEGLGSTGAARLLAAVELGRRLSAPSDDPRPHLSTPSAIYEWARTRLVGSRREEFYVLCLNARNALLRTVRVAEGSVDQCHVDPREVFGPAVSSRATSIVLVHNHPSGDPEPSAQDVALTRQLKEGGRALCVRLLDHVVVTERGYVSMMGRGLLAPDFALPPSNRLT